MIPETPFLGRFLEPSLGILLGYKNSPREAKLAPRGLQGGTKKHQSDKRSDTPKHCKTVNIIVNSHIVAIDVYSWFTNIIKRLQK